MFSPRFVYILFVDMIRGPVDTILNILLFVPLGFFLPILYGKYDKVSKIALIGFLISLSIEIAQMFGTGATDINDLITNTIGACLGFGIYKLLYRAIPILASKLFEPNVTVSCRLIKSIIINWLMHFSLSRKLHEPIDFFGIWYMIIYGDEAFEAVLESLTHSLQMTMTWNTAASLSVFILLHIKEEGQSHLPQPASPEKRRRATHTVL